MLRDNAKYRAFIKFLRLMPLNDDKTVPTTSKPDQKSPMMCMPQARRGAAPGLWHCSLDMESFVRQPISALRFIPRHCGAS